MVKEAEAERGVREVVPLDVVLLDGVVYIVRQSYILGGGTATLVLVGGNVGAEVEGAQAFARDGLPSWKGLRQSHVKDLSNTAPTPSTYLLFAQ